MNPAKQVIEEKIYSKELVSRRTQLLHAALYFYRSLHPDQTGFNCKNELVQSFEPITDLPELLQQIYAISIHARPSTYCFESLH